MQPLELSAECFDKLSPRHLKQQAWRYSYIGLTILLKYIPIETALIIYLNECPCQLLIIKRKLVYTKTFTKKESMYTNHIQNYDLFTGPNGQNILDRYRNRLFS